MRAVVSAVAFVATAVVLLQANTAAAVCIVSGKAGQAVADYNDTNGIPSCRAGYYCPGFDPTNSSTYPEACLAEPGCALERLMGSYCEDDDGNFLSMGTFEPVVCPHGFYCPYNQGTKIECDSDVICDTGATEPMSCPAMSFCDGWKAQNYGFIVIWIVASIAVLLGYILYSRFGLSSTLTEDNGNGTVGERLIKGFRRARGDRAPFHLEFCNLAVAVHDKATGHTKHILRDMSGVMEPGTVTAIMGPSGAGKTTFMMALLGKKDPAWSTKGKLLVNGADKLGEMRHSIGFVPQDDVLHRELSVYKNLYYSSEVRLPHDWTAVEKAGFRSSIIETLGLTSIRDTVIGDEYERGVNSGQRKRASIGVELSAAPMAVFLDEPTSGLDSTTSLEVCSTLKKIAVETDLTVGMVIHQPRVEIWNGLDQVLFIGKGGRVVYQGPQADAQAFFERKCDVAFPPDANPADVIIDVIGENSDALADMWKVHLESNSPTSNRGKGQQAAFETVPEPTANESTKNGFHGAGFLRQLFLSHNRYVEKQLATMGVLRIEMIVCGLCGLILGQAFTDFDYPGFYLAPYRRLSPQPQTAMLPQLNMYSVMSVGLGAAPAGVRVFGVDQFSYFREAAAGHSPLAYFLGTLISVIYRCVFVSWLFAAAYFFIGALPLDFATFFLVSFFIYWNSYAVGMLASQLISGRMAPLVAQVVVMCIALMNGFVAVPVFIKQISFSFHAGQIVMQQWHNLYDHVFEPQFDEWGYTADRTSSSIALMFLLSLVLHVVAFGLMIGTNRDRQK